MSKRRLGKGLGALIPVEKDSDSKFTVPVSSIEPNPFQPRKNFNKEAVKEMAQSIEEHGIVQPLILRKTEEKDFYQIVAGERRWRGAKEAGLEEVPAIIRDYSDQEMMEVALIENIQREDLNPIEEANAFQRLIQEFGLTQEDLSTSIGKSRSAIANTIRLLNLPEVVQEYVSRGTFSMGHARALLSLPLEDQEEAANQVVALGLTVRQTELLVKEWKKDKKRRKSITKNIKDQEVVSIEKGLEQYLETKVLIRPKTKNKGTIQIGYNTMDELKKIWSLVQGK